MRRRLRLKRSDRAPMVVAKFLAKIRILPTKFRGTNCWGWKGKIDAWGYATFSWRHAFVYRAARFAYEIFVGPIRGRLEIDHLCRTRECVNPLHLEPVTGRINTLRGNTRQAENARKTHCLRGHPLSGENLVYAPAHSLGGLKRRQCRECMRSRWRIFARKKRAERAAA